ncbi:helix-turn-helix domain-containing protein [Nocardiopsis sp. N85]|uniref:helix-turn-helix domain-containing protein n=1 Tax=Nocardiopsis sp. N85 TaxID=3029400 RepID=UPI00237FAB6C|nr:helix-turn-helix domain-containing protein [Nocardiopsis sp. N85]MDE3725337.1 helix-turn-helix domain-containing protein [Nocardiopsis sp. N85]
MPHNPDPTRATIGRPAPRDDVRHHSFRHRRSQGERWSAYLPDQDEAAHLAATFGATLRRLRTDRGLSVRGLASRAMVAHTTVLRLEAGLRRPRPVIIEALANALDPHDPEPAREALTRAAGGSLRPDTERGVRAHHRRVWKVVEERGLMGALVRHVAVLVAAGEGDR